ncbi:hypothetical protein [Ammoniphilus resinae]|uniref:Uncharacterized protein n=1 Tax=Ammoniphilus resinae TaxID=861532 RepID=A0ABS4GX84_9BACL|nr:hypothetical protein [Ammoniphilus resinae]MBP1934876.1 hypothetical protein [Ammoniphilus resinae]
MVQFPTDEEMQAIKRSVIIPMVITVLHRDKKILEESEIKTKGPYIALMESALKKAEKEWYDARRLFRSNGIKVYEEKRTETEVEIKYVIRGYHHVTSLPWHVVKQNVEEVMKSYFGVE